MVLGYNNFASVSRRKNIASVQSTNFFCAQHKFFSQNRFFSRKIRDGCSYCQIFDGEHGHTGSLLEWWWWRPNLGKVIMVILTSPPPLSSYAHSPKSWVFEENLLEFWKNIKFSDLKKLPKKPEICVIV